MRRKWTRTRIHHAVQTASSQRIQEKMQKTKARIQDVKDVAKVAGHVASGDVVSASITALKNKRMRKWLIFGSIGVMVAPFIGMMFMASMIVGMAEMFRYPMMHFGPKHTVVERQIGKKPTTVHFTKLAQGWEKTIRWEGHKGLTPNEIAQVNQLNLNLSYGLLEALYEVGVRQGATTPVKTMHYVVQQLQPSKIHFQSVKLRKVGHTAKGKKYFYYVTKLVLQDITRYNGKWVTQWHIITHADGSQDVVLDSATLSQKNYTPLYNAEQAFNFLHTTKDQQTLFGQALVLDPNFYDPSALPILQVLEGSNVVGSGSVRPVNVHVTVAQLRYQNVSAQALYSYVHARNSIFSLTDIEIIMAAAKSDDVNPALLVAITGQEQSFVPANTSDAMQIASNPFNVEGPGQSGPGSWQTFHASLSESAQIAANTVAMKLSTPPPAGENPIQWMNDPKNPDGIYATDTNWANGVAEIFQSIETYVAKNANATS